MLLDNSRTTPDLDRKGRSLIHLNIGKRVCWVMLSSLIFPLSLRALLEPFISQKIPTSCHVEDGDRNVTRIQQGSCSNSPSLLWGSSFYMAFKFPTLTDRTGQGSQLCPLLWVYLCSKGLAEGLSLESLGELGWSSWYLLSQIICEVYRPAIAVTDRQYCRQYAITVSLSSTGSILLQNHSCPVH